MIKGFEDAFDAFCSRQEVEDEKRAKTKAVNGEMDSELAMIREKIKTIRNNIWSRDSAHRSDLPPEAFQGYGGQTPQYVDDWHYGPSDAEYKELDTLIEKEKEILEKYA